MDRLIFASLNLPALDCEELVKKLMQLPKEVWGYDSYRHTFIAPMLTYQGDVSRNSIRTFKSNEKFSWTEFAPQVLKDYFENHIFHWMNSKPRVMILRTDSNSANREHIDCTKEVFGRPHYKFRYVLQGNVNDLYFITNNKRIYAPDTHKPFIMDGGWPHGMVNRSSQIKFTICAGAPWSGHGSDLYQGLEKVVVREQDLPQLSEDYFEAARL